MKAENMFLAGFLSSGSFLAIRYMPEYSNERNAHISMMKAGADTRNLRKNLRNPFISSGSINNWISGIKKNQGIPISKKI